MEKYEKQQHVHSLLLIFHVFGAVCFAGEKERCSVMRRKVVQSGNYTKRHMDLLQRWGIECENLLVGRVLIFSFSWNCVYQDELWGH